LLSSYPCCPILLAVVERSVDRQKFGALEKLPKCRQRLADGVEAIDDPLDGTIGRSEKVRKGKGVLI
jgi:hypothetical protein